MASGRDPIARTVEVLVIVGGGHRVHQRADRSSPVRVPP